MSISDNTEPVNPRHVRAFALFFKRYMSVSTLVVASLPIPVTALRAIPTFKAHTKILSVYTPLFCFLALGFIFYSRHKLARIMFPEYFSETGVVMTRTTKLSRGLIRTLPVFLIGLSMLSVVLYHGLLNQEVGVLMYQEHLGFNTALEIAAPSQIHDSALLVLLYLSIFLTAEGAFVLMAIKEYLQDLVGLTEMDLIKGPPRPKIKIINDV